MQDDMSVLNGLGAVSLANPVGPLLQLYENPSAAIQREIEHSSRLGFYIEERVHIFHPSSTYRMGSSDVLLGGTVAQTL